jgi:leucyl aminopeptidase
VTSTTAPQAHTPSLDRSRRAAVSAANQPPASATATAVFVSSSGNVATELGLDRAALDSAGFTGSIGSTLVIPSSTGGVLVAVGIGDQAALTVAGLRNAAAAFAKAAASHESLAIHLGDTESLSVADAAQAATEGAALARYRYDVLRSSTAATPLKELTIVSSDSSAAQAGLDKGMALASATMLARDLANAPHNYLTASRLADIAVELGSDLGFGVEVFDEKQMAEMGIGGILGVNAGSAEPPRLIKLTYAPAGATARLAMVGKGIMYDSGGLALKPGDAVHAAMKNDMSGAGAILAAVAAMASVGSKTAVTGYLMCTDSMPSGTAMAMGDVITIRGGTTIEVVNTDAEGRLVMADGLVMAVEDGHDAVIDIATLTGACMRALGTEVAGVFGNNQGLVDQVRAAGDATDEPVWQLPLYRGYRKQLDSPVADMKNLGYGEGGAITAALFLEEFVDGLPWAHIDIAGVAQSTDGRPWHTPGTTGFGARLLVELASNYRSVGEANRSN